MVEPFAGEPTMTAAVRLTLETDSGQALRLACGPARVAATDPPVRVRPRRRPGARVLGAAPELAFAKDTFADRRLLQFGAGEVRGLEILPGADAQRRGPPERAPRPRRVAPRRPGPPRRRRRARRGPPRGPARRPADRARRGVGVGPGDRPAAHAPGRADPQRHRPRTTRSRSSCTTAASPASPASARPPASPTRPAPPSPTTSSTTTRCGSGSARPAASSSPTCAAPPRTVTVRRDDSDNFSVQSGDPTLTDELRTWNAFRSAGIRRGEPRGAAATSARITRTNAATVRVDLGPVVDGTPAWVRLAGADWHYLAGPPSQDPE
jgi:hypothetical protein